MSNQPGAINIGSGQGLHDVLCQRVVRFCRDSFADRHSALEGAVLLNTVVPPGHSSGGWRPLLQRLNLGVAWDPTISPSVLFSISGNLGKIRSQFQSLK